MVTSSEIKFWEDFCAIQLLYDIVNGGCYMTLTLYGRIGLVHVNTYLTLSESFDLGGVTIGEIHGVGPIIIYITS